MASNKGVSGDCFRKLLSVISQFYDRWNCINRLKVLYSDHIETGEIFDASTTKELLDLLISYGDLNRKDLKILYDTIKATGHFGLEEEINAQIPSCPNLRCIVISKFKAHRQKLMKLGKTLTKGDVKSICGFYCRGKITYDDSWCLIMNLEHEMIICEEKMEEFIENLRRIQLPQAVKCLTEDISNTSSSSGSGSGEAVSLSVDCNSQDTESEDEPRQSDPLMSLNVTVTKEGKLRTEFCAELLPINWLFRKIMVVFEELCSGSLVFRLSVSDPNALENLYNISVSGELIKDFAEILVPAEFQEEFVQRWSTNINDREYDVALSKLKAKGKCDLYHFCIISDDPEWETTLMEELKQKRPDLSYIFMKRWRLDKPETINHIIGQSKNVIVGFSPKPLADYSKYAAHSVVVEMLEAKTLDDDKIIPFKISGDAVVPPEFELLTCHVWEEHFVDKLLQNKKCEPHVEISENTDESIDNLTEMVVKDSKEEHEMEISKRNTDPTEMVLKDSKEVQSDLYDFCFISDNSKFENKLMEELQERIPDIKCTSKQDLNVLNKDNLINQIDKSKKVILGFSTQPATVHPKSAVNVVKEMLEENTLHHAKVIPVKISEDALVPPDFKLFTVMNGWEDHFVEKLLQSFESKSAQIEEDYSYNPRMLEKNRSWSLPNISGSSKSVHIDNDSSWWDVDWKEYSGLYGSTLSLSSGSSGYGSVLSLPSTKQYATSDETYDDYSYDASLFSALQKEYQFMPLVSVSTGYNTTSDPSFGSTIPYAFDSKSTKEIINFLATYTLVIDRGTKEMRRYFLEKNNLTEPEVQLYLLKEKHDGFLWYVDKTDNIEAFDMDILMKLIYHCCNNTYGEDFWENPPNDDNSQLANFIRIYQYKKTILDCSYSIRVTDEDFDNRWKELTAMFTGVGEIDIYCNLWQYKETMEEVGFGQVDIEEIRNFLAILSVVIDVGTATMHRFLLEHNHLKREDVGRYLMNEKLKGSFKNVVITGIQMTTMFTLNAVIESFDISLMFLIICNCCRILPTSFWAYPERLRNVIKIHHYRKNLALSPNCRMSSKDFEIEWKKVRSMLNAAGASSIDIDKYNALRFTN